ncbi:conserved hypothetical protein [Vibrio phage 501E54-1]|nr:conserved hypothetical protein [Vibrio phage 501E54-1]
MSYECIYCGAELEHHDTWGIGAYWQRENKPEGEVYRCPNHEGFEDCESAVNWYIGYYDEHPDQQLEDWTQISCESITHHVSGMFYTDRSGDLKEGYPC